MIEKEQILEATIDYVAKHGLENVSALKVAKSIGISEGTIFKDFHTMRQLLVQCLYYVDHQIDEELHSSKINVFKFKDSIWELWHRYFTYLTCHGSYTKFYRQFRQSSYYTQDVVDGQDKSFAFFAAFVHKNLAKLGVDPDIFWVFVIETTLNFAARVADGQLSNKPADVQRYFNLIFYGIGGLIRRVDKSKLELEL